MTTTNNSVAEMKIPEPFYIDSSKSRMYYNNTDLFQYNKLFFYGCTTKPKTIITKKLIPETEYLYANLKKNEWNLSSVECKKSQLLISKEWVDTYYFKIDERKVVEKPIKIVTELVKEESIIDIPQQEPNHIVEESTIPVKEKEEIVEAPRLLILNENEKFKDADGNIIEIETRGTKERKNIYFKVADVSNAFDMKYLNDTLLGKDRGGYVRNIHYKTFVIKTNNNAYTKSLYLTYYGFLRVIHASRTKHYFFVKNIIIINKWLDYLINNKYCENYIISNVTDDLSGVVYICSSPIIDAVKIGYWTGSITGLLSRYRMIYGKDVSLNCKNVENVRNIEKELHDTFRQYNISGELFKKDKLHIYNDYLNNNIVEYLDRNFKEDYDELNEDDETESIHDENEIIEQAPRIIHLNNNEKFRDTDGNIVEIETRGSKTYDNIYFKVTDVSKGFNMENLRNSIQKKDRGYVRNNDYKTFLIRGDIVPSTDTNKNNKPSLYLTYSGLLRVLFVSRNKNVERFQEWAMKTLFTIQMGKEEEKVKLGTSILNIPEKTYKAVFQKHANKLPCIYLFSLGKVGELRNTFDIDNTFPDDSVVYKYGYSHDLGERLEAHESNYGKLENVKIVLTTFHGIDPIYLVDAERDIREECNAYEIKLKTEGYRELIVLNKKQLEHVKKNYKRIGRDYAGHTAELQCEISKLKEEIRELNHERDRLKTHIETTEKYHKLECDRLKTHTETTEKYHKLELNNKDLIIANLELQNKLLTR